MIVLSILLALAASSWADARKEHILVQRCCEIMTLYSWYSTHGNHDLQINAEPVATG